jgi:hypothetical protein
MVTSRLRVTYSSLDAEELEARATSVTLGE